MTIASALRKYPGIETELLLQYILKKPQEFLYLHRDKELTNIQESKLKKSVNRRYKGEPIAYIVGYKYFASLKFKVNKNVLIPRPETEWIVNKVLDITLKNDRKFSILDIGTGSGIVAITLALTSLQKVTAVDISKKALRVAKNNAAIHKARVAFKQSDLLSNVKEKFDIIIANLPYVPQNVYIANYENLKHEPKSALVDKKTNGDLYTQLFFQIATKKLSPSYIILEIDPELVPIIKKSVKTFLSKGKLTFYKDLHNLYRYAIIKFTK